MCVCVGEGGRKRREKAIPQRSGREAVPRRGAGWGHSVAHLAQADERGREEGTVRTWLQQPLFAAQIAAPHIDGRLPLLATSHLTTLNSAGTICKGAACMLLSIICVLVFACSSLYMLIHTNTDI